MAGLTNKSYLVETLAGVHLAKDAEKADHSLRFGGDGKKKKAKDLTPDEAASKIQRTWQGKAAR